MRQQVRFRDLAAVAAAAAALAVGAARARADVAPSEKSDPPCTAPGQPCIVDGLEGDKGTCFAATCTKQVRNHRDGVTTPVAIPCFECRKGGAGRSTSPPKSSGCAVAAAGADAGGLAVGGAMSLIAGLVLVTARRRGRRP